MLKHSDPADSECGLLFSFFEHFTHLTAKNRLTGVAKPEFGGCDTMLDGGGGGSHHEDQTNPSPSHLDPIGPKRPQRVALCR